MAKSDRITIRLDDEIRAKLHAKASALGLNDADLPEDIRSAIDAELAQSYAEHEPGGMADRLLAAAKATAVPAA
jgi:hypothetical protein